MSAHLGHEKNRAELCGGASNVRNGTGRKTASTEARGHIESEVPRDRDGQFKPVIVKKRRRRLNGVDRIVLSL